MIDFDDLKELFEAFAKVIFIAIMLLTIISLLIVPPLYFLDKITCEKTANKLGLESYYDFWTGCIVRVDDRWIDIRNYNEVGVK